MNKKMIMLSGCFLVQQMYGMGLQRGESSVMGARRGQSAQDRVETVLTSQEEQNWQTHQEDAKSARANKITFAASNGGLNTVRQWLDGTIKSRLSKKDLLLLRDKGGSSALIWAVSNNQTEVVTDLLDLAEKESVLKEVLQAESKDGSTALSWAAGENKEAVLKLLLDAVSKINVQADAWKILTQTNSEGLTLLMRACIGGSVSIVKSILQAVDRYKISQEALTAFINAQTTQKGRTAIQWAIRFAQGSIQKGRKQNIHTVVKEMVDAILEYPHVNLYMRDNEGRTAIYWATYIGLDDILRSFDGYLQKHDISMDVLIAEVKAAQEKNQRILPSALGKRRFEGSDDN